MTEKRNTQPEDDQKGNQSTHTPHKSELDFSAEHIGTDVIVRDGERLHVSKK